MNHQPNLVVFYNLEWEVMNINAGPEISQLAKEAKLKAFMPLFRMLVTSCCKNTEWVSYRTRVGVG